MNESSKRVIAVIQRIPEGRVLSYGAVASEAGMPRGARLVARLLHSSSRKYNLPWHRVINSRGRISLTGRSGKRQRDLLVSEGVQFRKDGSVDLDRYAADRSPAATDRVLS